MDAPKPHAPAHKEATALLANAPQTLSWLARMSIASYLPSIAAGMTKTLEWMFRPAFTLRYPEQQHVPRKGYRGEHRLKKDDQGIWRATAIQAGIVS